MTLADVEAAAETIRGAVRETPTSHSRDAVGHHRRPGLAEVREPAVHRRVQGARRPQLPGPPVSSDERAAGVVAASAGNHAQGVAYHAHLLDIPATIVMPADTPFTKVSNTAHHGAEVVLEGTRLRRRTSRRAAHRGRDRVDTRSRVRRPARHRGSGHDRPRDPRADVQRAARHHRRSDRRRRSHLRALPSRSKALRARAFASSACRPRATRG